MRCWWEESGETEELDFFSVTAKTELCECKLVLICQSQYACFQEGDAKNCKTPLKKTLNKS